MLRISPCIEMVFSELDFYDRFRASKDAGAGYCEFWGWGNKDLGRVKEESQKNGIQIAAICVDTKTPAVAEVYNRKKLLYREPEAQDAFVAAVKESLVVANALSVPTLIVTVGDERKDIPHVEQHTNVVLALKKVVPLLEDDGIQMVLEPLNVLANHMGYMLPSGYEAFGIVEEVGSPAVKVLYDIYHQQITEGNLIPTIRKYIHQIGHFHVADVPGRHEPGTGEINYRNVFSAIEELGYQKAVGLEYTPTKDSAETVREVIGLLQ